MKVHSKEFKEAVVARMLQPGGKTATEIAAEIGVCPGTLTYWKKQFGGLVINKPVSKNRRLNSEQKLDIILETGSFNEEELAHYCRGKGIFVEDILGWKQSAKDAFGQRDPSTSKAAKGELAAERLKIKKLQVELRRKEKALAETAALLVLQKKAQAIWGEGEDD